MGMPTTFLLTSVGFLLLVVDSIVVTSAIYDYQYGRATLRHTAGLVTAAVALIGIYVWIVLAIDSGAVPR